MNNIPMRKLSEVSTITSGGTPSRARDEYWGGEIPWLTTSEVARRRIRYANKFITDEGLKASSAKVYGPGTVLVAMYGQGRTRGQSAILEIEAATNQAFAAIVPSPQVDATYLFQYLDFSYEELRRLSNVGGQDNLSIQLIRKFSIPLPDRSTQKHLARILDMWDTAVKLQERQLLAARTRFGAIRKTLTAPRPSWDSRALRDVSTPVTRKTDARIHPVMTIAASAGFVIQSEKYRRDMAGASLAKYTLLKKGEFAYNKGNSLTFPSGCIYRLSAETALVPSVYIPFHLNESLHADFYASFFAAGSLNDQLALRISSGVRSNGLLNITSREFYSVEIPIPPIREQISIASALSFMRKEIAMIEEKLQLLREQKRGLAQRLFSGELRVDESSEEMSPT